MIPARLRGVVLDLDGLLIDSERWSWEAHNSALVGLGLAPLAIGDVRRLIGLDAAGEWRVLREMRAVLVDRDSYAREQGEAFEAIRGERLAPLPGVPALIETVRARSLRLALASNSHRRTIVASLEGLGILDAFDAIASADDVAAGKPEPLVYRLALERIGVSPGEAVAVEDSAIGLAAARAAGLFTIVVPGELTAEQRFEGAGLRVDSLHEVAAWLAEHTASERERRLW